MASVGDLGGEGGADPRSDHVVISGEGKGMAPNPIKRFFTTLISGGTAGESAQKGSPPFRRSTPSEATTGFLAHYANNISHFSQGAELFAEEIIQHSFGDDVYILEDSEFFGDSEQAGSAGPSRSVIRRIFPSPGPSMSVLRRILASAKPMKEQIARLSQTLKTLRETYGETYPAIKNMEDLLFRLEKLMESQSKKIAEASEKGAAEEASAIRKMAEALKSAEESEVSALIKETDKFLKTAEIPLEMHERVKKAFVELKELREVLGGFIFSLGMFLRGYGFAPAPVNPPSPVHPPTPNPAPVSFLKAGALPIPFNRIGERAKDVLFADYEESPFHAIGKADFLLFDKKLGLDFILKSDPTVEMTLRYGKEYDDYLLQSKAKVVFPLGDTSQANVDLIHRQACLSGSVGLTSNPTFDVSGVLAVADGLCGGARLCFESGGSVKEVAVGASMETSKFGNVSALIVNQRKLQILFDKRVGRATGAAELKYLHDPVPEQRAVCLTGGLSYKYDANLTLKGRFSSDLHVGGMIQFEERLASTLLRATADVNLRAMDQPPRVGFQVVFDPTWK